MNAVMPPVGKGDDKARYCPGVSLQKNRLQDATANHSRLSVAAAHPVVQRLDLPQVGHLEESFKSSHRQPAFHSRELSGVA